MKVLLPNTIPLAPRFPAGVTTASYDVRAAIPAEHRDAEAVVIWLSSPDRLAAMVSELPNLRWIQSLMAGTDSIEAAGFDASVALTSGKGLHDTPVAEHAMALILAAARRLDISFANQHQASWQRSWDADKPFGTAETLTSLYGTNVLIWGFGAIGLHLAKYLQVFSANVEGIARSNGERGGFKVHTSDELNSLLPTTDVLVNIMPATPATTGVINADVFTALPGHAWFINVGRGASVDEPALVEALETSQIGGAALDVFATEPLPTSSPLWHTPNTIITPHAAGGRPDQPERLLEENVRRLLAGEELVNLVTH